MIENPLRTKENIGTSHAGTPLVFSGEVRKIRQIIHTFKLQRISKEFL